MTRSPSPRSQHLPDGIVEMSPGSGRYWLIEGATATLLFSAGQMAELSASIAQAMPAPLVPVKRGLPNPADRSAYARVLRAFDNGALAGNKRGGRWFGNGAEIAQYAVRTARKTNKK